MNLGDILAFEKANGIIPVGSVVMIRSDFHKRWDEVGFAKIFPFPGVTLEALKFLHINRTILFHGPEVRRLEEIYNYSWRNPFSPLVILYTLQINIRHLFKMCLPVSFLYQMFS